ncbi:MULTISPECIES: prephenate dehydrogenase [Salimicrobium]|uniref:Prephenate dehydrogenase n=1 Tax=Salimicrobium humidisoli TaxID=2029857 RepID=A0ABX4HQJ6_9BACI|nr:MULTISPECIES: prephenate dehydrogenase [Salimicrobium]PBB05459.1 prephenate dehydrogenase [Salimicrobium humidisoli]
MNKTVVVAGLGLIGGSLAMNIKKEGHFILGHDEDVQSLELAYRQGVIDEKAGNLYEALPRADVLVLALPITTTVQVIRNLNDVTLSKDLLVTDVSSVKNEVMKEASLLANDRITFIGGHPMSGSHKNGFTAAKPHLFENAIYVLSPVKDRDEKTKELRGLLEATKARFVTLSPQEHDEMTAVISHFPHLIASSLVQQAKKWQHTHPELKNLAAGGFRDITRIASSNPPLWQDIFFQNKQQLVPMLEDWIQEMTRLKEYLQTDSREETLRYLTEAKTFRDGLPVKEKGAIPGFYDIFVDIYDQPGTIHKVIEVLAEAGISIKNIEILEIREGITGVLRISFPTGKEQEESALLLRNKNYEVVIEQ